MNSSHGSHPRSSTMAIWVRFSRSPRVQHQQHFIVPALNFDFLPQLEMNLGVGIGLTRASNGTFVKTIIGWTF